MACKYTFAGKEYTEQEFKSFVNNNFVNQPKTLMLFEQQSDWKQKLRLTFVLNKITHYIEETKQGKKYWIDNKEVNSNTYNKAFDDFIDRGEIIKDGTPEQIVFARLILRNWDEFSIKSIIQDSAKKGYEKVLFPTGNTASKVEGHTTLEEFKKQKEDRIKELEEKKKTASSNKPWLVSEIRNNKKHYFNTEKEANEFRRINGQKNFYSASPTSSLKDSLKSVEDINNEINQLKQELERVEKEGFDALKPIYNFYENTVSNILKKQGLSPNVITDEYGNTWNEIIITPEIKKAIDIIKFQAATLQYKGDLAIEEKIAELIEKSKDYPSSKLGQFIQDIIDFFKDLFSSKSLIDDFIKDINNGSYKSLQSSLYNQDKKSNTIQKEGLPPITLQC